MGTVKHILIKTIFTNGLNCLDFIQDEDSLGRPTMMSIPEMVFQIHFGWQE